MKNQISRILIVLSFVTLFSCSENTSDKKDVTDNAPVSVGQSGVVDDVSQKNIVQVASGSSDHTTLVTAVKKAELVDVLSNAGPFTVFAPSNEAFNKLPEGTVDNLLKPESKEALQNILQYHVSVAVYKTESMQDGQVIGQVNGDNIQITVKNGKTMVNEANIIASIPASNGIIHVIDGVLLPPEK